MKHRIQQLLAESIGTRVEVQALRPVGGGSINQAAHVETTVGRFFAKWNDHPLPGQFAREAEGLAALAASGTSLAVPRVIGWRDADEDGAALLLLELFEAGRRRADFDERLGIGLAELHAATADAFGFDADNFCGATPQPNPWTATWPLFYREQRLRFQLERAARTRGLARADRQAVERLLEGLDDGLLGAPEPPALIHGDLWSGNVHATADGRPALIDPAAYYAHREAELGMMVLFGGFSPRVFEVYASARALQPGWRDRLPVYTLYHVLNHYNLFGGGYGREAFEMARHIMERAQTAR